MAQVHNVAKDGHVLAHNVFPIFFVNFEQPLGIPPSHEEIFYNMDNMVPTTLKAVGLFLSRSTGGIFEDRTIDNSGILVNITLELV